MSISYDPDGVPTPEPGAAQEGATLGLYPYHVICVEPDRGGDDGSVSFSAWGNFLPRIGDRIELQDGNLCEVKRVYFKTCKVPGSRLFVLLPNVYAIRISPDSSEGAV